MVKLTRPSDQGSINKYKNIVLFIINRTYFSFDIFFFSIFRASRYMRCRRISYYFFKITLTEERIENQSLIPFMSIIDKYILILR